MERQGPSTEKGKNFTWKHLANMGLTGLGMVLAGVGFYLTVKAQGQPVEVESAATLIALPSYVLSIIVGIIGLHNTREQTNTSTPITSRPTRRG